MKYRYEINDETSFFIASLSYGHFGLFVNDELYGTYASASLAADDVYHGYTGLDLWDDEDYDEPCDLSEWEAIF